MLEANETGTGDTTTGTGDGTSKGYTDKNEDVD